MILAKDEVIINEWEYATSKSKKYFSKHSLTVTNKRVVNRVQSKRKITQREVPVSSIQNISLSHEIPSKFCAIFLIVLGALLMCVGAVLLMGVINIVMPLISLIVGAVVLIIGLILVICGILRLNQGAFYLDLSTFYEEHQLMSVGVERLYGKKNIGSSVKFKINNDIAKQIIDTIGAVIIENK